MNIAGKPHYEATRLASALKLNAAAAAGLRTELAKRGAVAERDGRTFYDAAAVEAVVTADYRQRSALARAYAAARS